MTAENSGGISRLKRSQKPSIHAAAAATKSCRKTKRRRLYMRARPPHVDPDRHRAHHGYRHDNSARLYRGGLRPGIQRGRRAEEHQRIAHERRAAVPGAELHQPLVVVAPMRVPDALAAQETLEQRKRRIADEEAEHD